MGRQDSKGCLELCVISLTILRVFPWRVPMILGVAQGSPAAAAAVAPQEGTNLPPGELLFQLDSGEECATTTRTKGSAAGRDDCFLSGDCSKWQSPCFRVVNTMLVLLLLCHYPHSANVKKQEIDHWRGERQLWYHTCSSPLLIISCASLSGIRMQLSESTLRILLQQMIRMQLCQKFGNIASDVPKTCVGFYYEKWFGCNFAKNSEIRLHLCPKFGNRMQRNSHTT